MPFVINILTDNNILLGSLFILGATRPSQLFISRGPAGARETNTGNQSFSETGEGQETELDQDALGGNPGAPGPAVPIGEKPGRMEMPRILAGARALHGQGHVTHRRTTKEETRARGLAPCAWFPAD